MILDYPERIAFIKVVQSRFAKAGWTVLNITSDHCDFAVSSYSLRFRLRCIDETMIKYRSSTYLIEEMESSSNYLLSHSNTVRITVLSRNFLGVNLAALQDRNIFARVIYDLDSELDLVHVSNTLPTKLSEAQLLLLKKSVEYAVFVSSLYRKQGENDLAMLWAEIALEASHDFSIAHIHLFNFFLDLNKVSEAERLGLTMVERRPTDRRVVTCMVNLFLRKGDKVQAEQWRRRLVSDDLPPSLDEILQRQKNRDIARDPVQGSFRKELLPRKNLVRSIFGRLIKS